MALLNEVQPKLAAASGVLRDNAALGSGGVPHAVALLDAACIVVLSIACGAVYNFANFGQVGDLNRYFGVGIAVAILFSISAHARGLYLRSQLQQLGVQIKGMALVWTIVFLCLVMVAFALNASDALFGGTFLLFFVSGLGGIAVLRWSTRRVLVEIFRGARGKRQVIVVAQSGRPVSNSVARAIEVHGGSVCQTILLPETANDSALSECMREVIDYVRRRSVEEILLATSWADTPLIEKITGHLRVVPLPVKLVPDAMVSALLERPLVELGHTRAVELQRAPMTRPQRAAKRLLDIVATVAALPLVLPALAVFGAAVALDSRGPILFRQLRIGFNGRPFQIYKFRTMSTLENGAIIRQACQGDARVTRVGRVLRRFSIDELPQLLNVLKGEMSLVGPRPHALAHDNEYGQIIACYAARHNVKPGITGWAQMNGWRGATPEIDLMRGRVEHDLWYVDHWSLWLDIRILIGTVLRVCRAQNAY